jgi:hypothetical protein
LGLDPAGLHLFHDAGENNPALGGSDKSLFLIAWCRPPANRTPSMPYYRIYHLGNGDHISTPPIIVECADEREAIGKTLQAANGKAVELGMGRA